jgi:hypothetical protein
MTTTVKIYSIQPHLDVPAQSCIKFPLWLKCLYNIAQMELTTLDPLGAFYLVALARIGGYVHKTLGLMAQFTLVLPSLCPHRTPPTQQLGASACPLSNQETMNCNNVLLPIFTRPFVPASVASRHQFGTESLSHLDLVNELKAMFGTITKQEIDATQAIISAPVP